MKYSKLLNLCMAIFSVICMVLIINDNVPTLAKKYFTYSFSSCSIDNGDEFEVIVREGTIKTIKEESWNNKPFANSKSLTSYLFKRKTSVYGFGEYALLLHYAYQYANIKDDKEIKELVKNKFDMAFISNAGEGVLRNDQVAYGNVAIDLYLETRDDVYHKFASLVSG